MGTFGAKNESFRAFGASDVQEATKLVDISLEAGLNMFDSADVYSNGTAEEVLGQAIKNRRDQVIISTKATFRSGPGHNDVGSSRHHLIKACESSLRRLGTDYIDIYQMHGFDALTPVEETLSALDDMVHSGKVRYIGCSNFWVAPDEVTCGIGKTRPLSVRGASGLLFTGRTGLRMGVDAAGVGPKGRDSCLESSWLGATYRKNTTRAALTRNQPPPQPSYRGSGTADCR
jgi:hypothetical protein